MAEQAEREHTEGVKRAVAVAVAIATLAFGLLFFAPRIVPGPWSIAWGVVLGRLLRMLLAGVAVYGVAVRLGRMEPAALGFEGASLRPALVRMLRGSLTGFIAVAVTFVVAWLAQGFVVFPAPPEEWPQGGALLRDGFGLMFAAVFEELCFRVGLVLVLRKVLPMGLSVALPAALFGLAHGQNAGVTAIAVLNTTLAGVLLGLMILDRRKGSLGLAIGFHFAWNYTMGPLLGIPVSGLPAKAHYLAVEAADVVWSGGSYGLEGGLACLITMSALCMLWAYRLTRTGAAPAAPPI
jgi:membrane protease YdiL (CAAX protease family)